MQRIYSLGEGMAAIHWIVKLPMTVTKVKDETSWVLSCAVSCTQETGSTMFCQSRQAVKQVSQVCTLLSMIVTLTNEKFGLLERLNGIN